MYNGIAYIVQPNFHNFKLYFINLGAIFIWPSDLHLAGVPNRSARQPNLANIRHWKESDKLKHFIAKSAK